MIFTTRWPQEKCQEQNDGEFSYPCPVTNGVKQGCVLASTLFSMMFSAMLTDAFLDGDNGIPIRNCFDGKLFNLRRLQAKPKVQTEVLDEFLFADDMAKGAPTEEKMQKGIDQVSDSRDSYNLTISIKKTEVASTWKALSLYANRIFMFFFCIKSLYRGPGWSWLAVQVL